MLSDGMKEAFFHAPWLLQIVAYSGMEKRINIFLCWNNVAGEGLLITAENWNEAEKTILLVGHLVSACHPQLFMKRRIRSEYEC
jgi:hypothetical protein